MKKDLKTTLNEIRELFYSEISIGLNYEKNTCIKGCEIFFNKLEDVLNPLFKEDKKIEIYTISTCMGQIRKNFSDTLSFLSETEIDELDNIGYTGKNFKGEKITKTEYLNSLNKGEFVVQTIQYDKGDFCETFKIIRVI